MAPISGTGSPGHQRTSNDYARKPHVADEGAPSVTIGSGDTGWAVAAKELGPEATPGEINARVAQYSAANPGIDINKLIVGDKLTVPPRSADGTWGTPVTPRKPVTGSAAEAATQTSASQAAAAVEREAGVKTLNQNLTALAGNAAKMSPMTDTQKWNVADMARELFKRADALGVGAEVRGTEAGKQLQGLVNELHQADVGKAAEDLVNKAIATQNSQRAPLDEGQKRALAKEAAPLLDKARGEGVSTEATKRLQSLVDETDKRDLGKALDDLANKAIATQNGQRGPLTDSQKRDLANQARPLLQKARDLGFQSPSTHRMQAIFHEARHHELQGKISHYLHSGPGPQVAWSNERLAEGAALYQKVAQQAPDLLKTEEGQWLKGIIDHNPQRLAAPGAMAANPSEAAASAAAPAPAVVDGRTVPSTIDDETRARARAAVAEALKKNTPAPTPAPNPAPAPTPTAEVTPNADATPTADVAPDAAAAAPVAEPAADTTLSTAAPKGFESVVELLMNAKPGAHFDIAGLQTRLDACLGMTVADTGEAGRKQTAEQFMRYFGSGEVTEKLSASGADMKAIRELIAGGLSEWVSDPSQANQRTFTVAD